MYNHRAKPYINRHGKREPGFDGYDCSTYKLSNRGTREVKCKSHHISTKALREVTLYTIKNACKYAIEDRDAFAQKVRRETEIRNTIAIQEGKAKYSLDKKRLQELDRIYKKLYESYATGIISGEKFKMLSESYETEQKDIKERIRIYETAEAIEKKAEDDIKKFYDLVDRYTSFDELTNKMLNEFVEKVLVHKAEKIDGRRIQKVEVYLNFIGKIQLPEPEKTQAELEQEKIDKYWRDRYQRRKDYESARRKKKLEEMNLIVETKIEADRIMKIKEFNDEVKKIGIENMPVIPERLMNVGDETR